MNPNVRGRALALVALAAFAAAAIMASQYSEAYRAISAGEFHWGRYLAQVEAKLAENGVAVALPHFGRFGPPPTPKAKAKAGIPGRARAAYLTGAGQCKGLHPAVLAAVGKVESDHGRSRLPGVRSGWNRAGAAGPMQFGIGRGRAGNAWARYGRGNVYDLEDATAAAARKLCADGAPRNYRQALHSYNHSWAYVARVLAIARTYDREVY